MKVTVEFLSLPVLTRAIGSKSLDLDFKGRTIDDLLKEIADRYGPDVRRFLFDDAGRLDMALRVHLNRKEWIYQDQTDRALNDGDHVVIMMLVGGG